MRRIAAILLFLCLPAVALERSQITFVSGRIFDANSLSPLAGVEIRWNESKTISDAAGYYHLKTAPGIRQIFYRIQDRLEVRKLAIVPEAGAGITLDTLIPSDTVSRNPESIVLQLRLSGKRLASDFDGEPNLAIVDSLGNLTMTLATVPPAQCPVWLNSKEVVYGVDTIAHKEDFGSLGIYKWNLQNGSRTAVATGAGVRFVDSSSAGIVAANYKQVFVVQGSGLKEIFHSGKSTLLSIAWGNDRRIYLTINDDFPLSSTRSAVKSRIASLQSGGDDLRNLWEDQQDSFRYPAFHGDQMFWSRFSADGREQAVWQAGGHDKEELVLRNALRIVHPAANGIYYLYKDSLRWKHRESDSDLILAEGVLSAAARSSY